MKAIVVAVILCVSARAAAAYDCYEVKKGAKLYAEVMAQTEVGETTADVVGWFGRGESDEPTVVLRFVALEGDEVRREINAYVLVGDAKPVTCPEVWKRTPGAKTVELTWSDARHAGQAVRTAISARLKKAKKAHGRGCFAVEVPGVAATVCAPVASRTKSECVSIASGKDVFARASTAHRLGQTTERVVAVKRARVGDMLAVRIEGDDDSVPGYVRNSDAKPARCPESDNVATLKMMPRHEALLPDGTDAGFGTNGPGMMGKSEKVEVGGRTLHCFEETPVPGFRMKICI